MRTARCWLVAAVVVATTSSLAACSQAERKPETLQMSQEMLQLPDINGISTNGPSDLRTVAKIPVVGSTEDAAVMLGKNVCALTVKRGREDKTVSLDLSANPAIQAQQSSSIGSFFEVEMESGDGEAPTKWLLRCGESGVEVCSNALTPPVSLEKSGELDESWCFVVTPGKTE